MTDKTTDQYVKEAAELGKGHAEAAASWTCDGNTDPQHAARVLAMLRDGDPAADKEEC